MKLFLLLLTIFTVSVLSQSCDLEQERRGYTTQDSLDSTGEPFCACPRDTTETFTGGDNIGECLCVSNGLVALSGHCCPQGQYAVDETDGGVSSNGPVVACYCANSETKADPHTGCDSGSELPNCPAGSERTGAGSVNGEDTTCYCSNGDVAPDTGCDQNQLPNCPAGSERTGAGSGVNGEDTNCYCSNGEVATDNGCDQNQLPDCPTGSERKTPTGNDGTNTDTHCYCANGDVATAAGCSNVLPDCPTGSERKTTTGTDGTNTDTHCYCANGDVATDAGCSEDPADCPPGTTRYSDSTTDNTGSNSQTSVPPCYCEGTRILPELNNEHPCGQPLEECFDNTERDANSQDCICKSSTDRPGQKATNPDSCKINSCPPGKSLVAGQCVSPVDCANEDSADCDDKRNDTPDVSIEYTFQDTTCDELNDFFGAVTVTAENADKTVTNECEVVDGNAKVTHSLSATGNDEVSDDFVTSFEDVIQNETSERGYIMEDEIKTSRHENSGSFLVGSLIAFVVALM